MAKIDFGNVMGPRGYRGSMFYSGTAIAGTETEGTVFAESGIEYALQEDKYLNTLTNDMYTCITEGDAKTAEWAWIGNIQGKQGIPGEPGPTGQVDENTPIEFEEAKTRQPLESGNSIGILFGKIKKVFSDIKETAFLSVVNDLETARAGEGVLDAYQGKVLSETKVSTDKILGTTEELDANTEDGYLADALLIKGLNDSLKEQKIKLLWENLNPGDSFAAQTIILASDDYDMLIVFYDII